MENLAKEISAINSKAVSNVYYDETSLHRSSDDVIFDNRFIVNFTSLALGSQGIQLNIPHEKLQDGVIVAMRFAGGAASVNTVGIVPVVAYAAIQTVQWTIGGSTLYQQDGIEQLWSNMSECGSKDKRDEIISLAGGAGSTLYSPGGADNSTTFYAWIRLPFSVLNSAAIKKMPLDSNLLSQPIRINLFLRNATSLYYVSAGTGVIPTNLTNAFFQVRQGQFKDKSHHLKLKYETYDEVSKQIVKRNDFYAYPFIYHQSLISAQFTGSINGSPAVQIPLTGFRSGNMLSIQMILYNITSGALISPATANTNFLATETPLNVRLDFNGLPLYTNNLDAFKMLGMGQTNADVQFAQTVPSAIRNYWVEMPISQWLPSHGEGYQQGINLSSQTLTCSFNTLAGDQYQAYFIYKYHAHALFDGENCEIVF